MLNQALLHTSGVLLDVLGLEPVEPQAQMRFATAMQEVLRSEYSQEEMWPVPRTKMLGAAMPPLLC